MTLDQVLSKMQESIDKYRSGAFLSLESMREVMRDLSYCHFALTKINIEAYKEYNSILYHFNGSVARGQIEADEQVPALRMSRKLLNTVAREIDSIRSEISIMKQE